jgi:hypothetical protein
VNVTKGIQARPVRAVIYGPEGIGKSTLASQFPAPLFVDTGGGTSLLDVSRTQPLSWAALEGIVEELTRDHGTYQTLAIDTADWAEKLLTEHVLATVPNDKGQRVASIEGYGYGKGYVHLAEGWKHFLDKVDRMQSATGMHVVVTAHSTLRHVDPPNEAPYDRYEMKVGKQSCAILKEWADLVAFLQYKTIVVETENGKNKAQGGKRTMYLDHNPCWDAKNRYGLKAEMPMSIDSLAPIFGTTPPPQAATAQVTKTPPPPAPVAVQPDPAVPADLQPAAKPAPAAATTAPEIDPAKVPLLEQLKQLMKGTVKLAELQAYMADKGYVPAGTMPPQYQLDLLQKVVANWAKVAEQIAKRRTQTA